MGSTYAHESHNITAAESICLVFINTHLIGYMAPESTQSQCYISENPSHGHDHKSSTNNPQLKLLLVAGLRLLTFKWPKQMEGATDIPHPTEHQIKCRYKLDK